MGEILYWQYVVNVWNHIDEKTEGRAGVVFAHNEDEAKAEIKKVFGDALVLIRTLEPIETEGEE